MSVLGLLLFIIVFDQLQIDGIQPIVPPYILLSAFFSITITSYIISKSQYDFEHIYRITTLLITTFIFFCSMYVQHVSIVIYLLYVPMLLMTLMLTNLRATIITSIFILIICYFTPILSESLIVAEDKNKFNNSNIIKFQDYVLIGFSSYLSIIILYFNNEFNKLKSHSQPAIKDNFITDSNTFATILYEDSKTDMPPDKMEVLYDRIISFFENEKPYTNPDFNITMLAKELDTNGSYISQTLRKKSSKNFRDFVNEYRINQVISELYNVAHKKFTIEHIYLKAGFIQQSTFNRVFKKVTGVTPSRYIEDLL
ncbi:helix-turn-helix domain-containing protein [Flavobacterium sp. PLA-1-15]